jgi:hypothetical protein
MVDVSEKRPLALSQRKKLAKSCPWITYLDQAHRCEGWHVTSGGKLSCMRKAHWHYRFNNQRAFPSRKRVRYYCWNHLITQAIHGYADQEERFYKWLYERYPKLKDIS